MRNTFESCKVERIAFKTIAIPGENSINRVHKHVLPTLANARRTGSSVTSSETEIVNTLTEQSEARTRDGIFDSSSVHTLIQSVEDENNDNHESPVINVPVEADYTTTQPIRRKAQREITKGPQQTIKLNTGEILNWNSQTVEQVFGRGNNFGWNTTVCSYGLLAVKPSRECL